MLLVTKVPRSLEKKVKLFGFELSDLMLVSVYLAMSDLIFGQTRLKFLMVWVGTAVIAAALYFLKRGKPDGFLQHYGEYWRAPSVLTAGIPDTDFKPLLEKISSLPEGELKNG